MAFNCNLPLHSLSALARETQYTEAHPTISDPEIVLDIPRPDRD
jgi:hypothetical protein